MDATARNHPGEGTHARVAALAVVVLFHAGVAFALMSIEVRRSTPRGRDDAILVQFIEPSAQAAMPARRHARQRRDRPTGGSGATAMPRPATATAATGPHGAIQPAAARPLQLVLPAVDVAIPDDPLRRPDRSLLEPPTRLRVEIVDRSFGGALQRFSRWRACGELRSAMRRSPNSAEAIRHSMERYRCDG